MQSTQNIWYVAHPTYVYNEDVKALAREARLIVVDPAVAPGQPNAADEVPALTIRAEYLPPVDELPAVEAAEGAPEADPEADPAPKGKGKAKKTDPQPTEQE